jgi:hypothetical protein
VLLPAGRRCVLAGGGAGRANSGDAWVSVQQVASTAKLAPTAPEPGAEFIQGAVLYAAPSEGLEIGDSQK